MQELIDALNAIKTKMGDTIRINRLLQDLDDLIKKETFSEERLDETGRGAS